MTFKSKLILAQVPLALALALVGAVSSTVTTRLGEQSGKIFVDNYRSIRAAQRMKESLERLDSIALLQLVGHGDRSTTNIARHREVLERELRVEEGNITEPGEGEAAAGLQANWLRCQKVLDAFLGAATAEQRDRLYFQALAPAFSETRQGADRILELNQDAIVRKSERVEQSARRFQQLITAAVLVALLGGLLVSISLTTRLLRPLGVVSAAVRRFGQGDLQARARLEGGDEIAQLAAEFNTMADHLARYRASSLGELLQAQQATQAAMDGLPDPVVMLESSGRVRGINLATSRLLGVDADLRPKDPLAAVDPAVRSLFDRLRAHVAGGRGPYLPKGFEEVLRVTAPDGEHIFLPQAAPIYGDAGEVAGVAIVLQDVTRLFRFDELKNNLVAIVAHEFRTPLTSLRMAIHLCTEEAVGSLTAKQADLLFAAREDCERLQAIVDDLLNLSRIESGNIELHRRRVAPEMLVALANDVHRSAAEARHIMLRSEVDVGCPETFADPDRLDLVFSNLLGNAIRYSPDSSEIVVRAKPEPEPEPESSLGRWVRFEVSDQGPGIPREHQAELFQKFYRVPGSPPGGSGLGLFIARGIVQAHGGLIGVVSEPGKGATFWFTVPAAPER